MITKQMLKAVKYCGNMVKYERAEQSLPCVHGACSLAQADSGAVREGEAGVSRKMPKQYTGLGVDRAGMLMKDRRSAPCCPPVERQGAFFVLKQI